MKKLNSVRKKVVQPFSTLGRLLLLVVIFAAPFSAFAQNKSTVRGRIVDANGEPLVGASVVIVGTSTGVATDLDGYYTLTGVKSSDALEFSYIGYTSQTQPVNSRTVIDVVLSEDNNYLDDVVVIGYGTVKRRDLTGSVASVSGEKLAKNPVSDVVQALQGALPGVSVTAQDGRPGASMDIRVRGGNSMTQSTSPLFIVDGVVVSSLEDIPADNIASIDVLKDAAATAIYGARGSNGVIMVTTQNAKEQKTTVRYNGYYQIKTPAKRLKVLDAQDYVWSQWSYMAAYSPNYQDHVEEYFGLGSKYGNHFAEYANVQAHDWFDDIIKNTNVWNHDVSISGGSDKTKFYVSVGYNKDDGIRINSGTERLTANAKLDHWITPKLKFNIDLRYANIYTKGSLYEISSTAYRFRPIDTPLGTDDPGLLMQGENNVNQAYNPYDRINDRLNTTERQRLRGNAGLSWDIVAGLTAKTDLSLARAWEKGRWYNGGLDDSGIITGGINKRDGMDMRWSTTLNYQVQGLGEDHSLSALVGYEVLTSKTENLSVQGGGYPAGYTPDDVFGMLNMTDASLTRDSFSNTIGTPEHTVSYFGRANYSYKGKYLFSATFRADGSSKFGPNNHWGYFPSAAAAWRISDEKFMAGAKSWLDDLKIRLSIGTSGADNINSSLWRETWKTTTVTVDGKVIPSYEPNSLLANESLKWETTTARNLGLDFGLWNNRLHGSIDFYLNTTKDNLMRVPIDNSTGYEYQYQNVGKLSNRGFDIALGADLVRGEKFNLTFGLTYNYNRNRVDALPEGILADVRSDWNSGMLRPGYDWLVRVGEPVGLINGFVSEGFYGVDDFDYIDGVYVLKPGVPDISGIVQYAGGEGMKPANQVAFPGVFKFKDINGDGIVNEQDATIVGRAIPHHTGGFNLSGNYKNFDFSAAFTYQIGGSIYNVNAMFSLMGNKDNNLGMNKLSFIKDCFTIFDVDAQGDIYKVTDPDQLRALNVNAKYGMPFSEYGIVTSDFVEDASYLRLQNITLGYTFPKKWVKKVGISNLRIYATVYNLFCLTGYSGLDPEVSTKSTTSGFPSPNYDYRAYPKSRTYTFGINLSF